MIGVQSTNALIALIYKKCFKISPATNKEFSSGEIVNFVQVDSLKLYTFSSELSNTAKVPLVLTFSFIFLFIYMGVSFLAGIGVFILATVFTFVLGYINSV
jgi:ATP-binding cassette subfamily C (CFTR/MRP) protein 2